jgi:YesN/AraC family two-component response regulator
MTHFLVKPLMQETLMDTIGGLRTSIKSGPILVVEDDPLERKLYKRLVNRVLPGYLAVTAETGKAALDFMAREIPSLVILHLGMPDIDGYTLLNKMRTRPATQRVPVVLMSGRTLTYEDVQRLDHMSVIFISKSILTEEETSGVFEQAVSGRNALPPQTSLVVKQVVVYLQQNYNRAITRHELADAVGVSQDYLSHIFHQELNLSPWDYLTRLRIKKATELLFSASSSIAAIACQVGFEDVSYFNRVFRKQTGCTPSAYRENSAKKTAAKETPQNGSGAP